VDPDATTPILAVASQALSEHGGGFSITASYGAILLPQESQDVTEAMRLVDQRMYAQKTSARRSPDRQSRDVLLRALQERNPELAEPHTAVARLAEAVGQRMGLVDGDCAQLRQAAELHDIGKLALPDDLLHKPGPLGCRGVGVRAPPPPDRRAHHRGRPRPGRRRPSWCTPPTNASTAAATPTG
jgi:hypothetical protein